MDVDRVGEKLLASCSDKGSVKDPADLYALTKEQLVQLERMGDKSAQNVLNSIEASKDRPLARLVSALNIRHVGTEIARLLADHFGSLDALLTATEEEINGIEGVGPEDRPQHRPVLRRSGVPRRHRAAARGRRPLRRRAARPGDGSAGPLEASRSSSPAACPAPRAPRSRRASRSWAAR
jgi:hypothetical protein